MPVTQIKPAQISQAGAATNQVLQWNGTQWAPATATHSGGPVYFIAQQDEEASDTTLIDSSYLTTVLAKGTVYELRFGLRWQCASNSGVKFGFLSDLDNNQHGNTRYANIRTMFSEGFFPVVCSIYSISHLGYAADFATGSTFVVEMTGTTLFKTTSNIGVLDPVFTLQFAQNTYQNNPTILKAGSFISLRNLL